MFSKLLVVLAMGVWDRFRGDDDLGISKNADALIMSICALYLMGHLNLGPYPVVFALSFVLAMALSYGGPWGAALNGTPMIIKMDSPWWQHGVLASNTFIALVFRGLLGAAILWPSCYLLDNFSPMVGIVLGFAISPYLSRYLMDRRLISVQFLAKIKFVDLDKLGKASWAVAEFFRGCIIGTTILGMS